MFNAQQLLGKIVRETLGNSGGGSGLMDSLGSGAGLMTVIGLGVGAYEILSEQKKSEQKKQTATGGAMPPPIPGQAAASPPPPPLPGAGTVPSPPPTSQTVGNGEENSTITTEVLARRMIRVMIAAAHADGTLDEGEEQAILGKLRGAELNGEEKMFLLDELHNPKTMEELTTGITDPASAKTMYLLAAGVIRVDTDAERNWLDAFGHALGLSPAVRQFLEEQTS